MRKNQYYLNGLRYDPKTNVLISTYFFVVTLGFAKKYVKRMYSLQPKNQRKYIFFNVMNRDGLYTITEKDIKKFSVNDNNVAYANFTRKYLGISKKKGKSLQFYMNSLPLKALGY